MNRYHEQDDTVTFEQTAGTGYRIFMAALGLFPLLGVYELIIKPRWHWEALFTLSGAAFMVIPLLIAAGCISICYSIIWPALLGPGYKVTVDRRYDRVRYEQITAFKPQQVARAEYALRDITEIYMKEDTSGDGPATYRLYASLPGVKFPLLLIDVPTQAEAERLLARIRP